MQPVQTVQQPSHQFPSENINSRRHDNGLDLSNVNDVENEDFLNRIKDIKNRIELRRMLAEYEAGNLKPPVYYKNPGAEGGFIGDYIDNDFANTNPYEDEADVRLQPQHYKRTAKLLV